MKYVIYCENRNCYIKFNSVGDFQNYDNKEDATRFEKYADAEKTIFTKLNSYNDYAIHKVIEKEENKMKYVIKNQFTKEYMKLSSGLFTSICASGYTNDISETILFDSEKTAMDALIFMNRKLGNIICQHEENTKEEIKTPVDDSIIKWSNGSKLLIGPAMLSTTQYDMKFTEKDYEIAKLIGNMIHDKNDSRNKINGIKLFREITGYGLKECKYMIDLVISEKE